MLDLKTIAATVFILILLTTLVVLTQLQRPLDLLPVIKTLDKTLPYYGFNTGDLIAVSYNSSRGKLVKIFTGSSWVHIGLIIIKNKRPYVLEIARYDEEKGQILKPLDEWLKWNKGRPIGVRKYIGPKKFPQRKLHRFIEQTKYCRENLFVVSWLQTCIKQSYRKKNKHYYYCSEYIAHMLQEIGILHKDHLPSGYKPWELLYGSLNTTEHHGYGESYQII